LDAQVQTGLLFTVPGVFLGPLLAIAGGAGIWLAVVLLVLNSLGVRVPA
jgi:hypothetical protein